MPPEALHRAITMPRISAVSETPADRAVAACTAWLNTPDAPGGSAASRPLTSRLIVLVPRWMRLARPSSAIRDGNRARNQW
jgi:hypothetical protein